VIASDKLGVLAGSLVSALLGYVVLHLVLPRGRSNHA
jgi:Na+/H+ antiporter NhaA